MRLPRPLFVPGSVLAATLLMAAGSLSAQQASTCLAALVGTWRGPGRVAGRDVVMQQEWRSAMQGAFTELRMTHHLPTDTTRVVFEGRGFYRLEGDTVSGTWMDARGLTMGLRGACRSGTLSMEWSGAERGASQYTLHGDGTLAVVDLVDTPGARREFGRSLLHRVAPVPR